MSVRERSLGRPSGTLFPSSLLLPALKRWAIVGLPLRGALQPLLLLSRTAFACGALRVVGGLVGAEVCA
jgi:hypothetical protein